MHFFQIRSILATTARVENTTDAIMIVDMNNLSDEVLLYSHDQFYQFVEDCLGHDEMILIKLQAIKSTRALLHVSNVLAVLDLNCPELTDLKRRTCFLVDNSNTVLKAGIKAGIEDFVATLRAKNMEYIQRSKRLKKASEFLQAKANASISSSANASAPTSASSSLSAASTIMTTTDSIPTMDSTPVVDYPQLIEDSIFKYSKTVLDDLVLSSNGDYVVIVTQSDTSIDAKIQCGCGAVIKINYRLDRNTFQLSPYFKHLKSVRCFVLKQKRKEQKKNDCNTSSVSNDAKNSPINDCIDSEDHDGISDSDGSDATDDDDAIDESHGSEESDQDDGTDGNTDDDDETNCLDVPVPTTAPSNTRPARKRKLPLYIPSTRTRKKAKK